MNHQDIQPPRQVRKPRIALMGEFSAGKSTLANVLMGQSLSPIRITATQVPPLWYSKGDAAPIRIHADGTEESLDDGEMHDVGISDTIAVRLFEQADILDACDIIDMPGSSDPNITVDIWQSVLPLADAVLWCTPATQAWRQSEAALWEEFAEDMGPYSLLLVSRIDKILRDEDRSRLLKRLDREIGDGFRNIFPVSLVMAQQAGEELSLWQQSGMEAILDELQKIVVELEPVIANKPAPTITPLRALEGAFEESASAPEQAEVPVQHDADQTDRTDTADAMRNEGSELAMPKSAVLPKRVTNVSTARSRRPRPKPEQVPDSLI